MESTNKGLLANDLEVGDILIPKLQIVGTGTPELYFIYKIENHYHVGVRTIILRNKFRQDFLWANNYQVSSAWTIIKG